MELTIKEMIEINNQKRKLLTPENEKYYTDMVVYIRSKFFRDERAIEEVLLEMLDHLLEAQKEGKNAEEVFGKSPKELADEIHQSLPKESIKDLVSFSLEILFTLFGWALIPFGVFTYFQDKSFEVQTGNLLLFTILLVCSLITLIFIFMMIVRKSSFQDSKGEKRQAWIFGGCFGGISVAVALIMKIVEPFGPTITLSYYTVLGLGCFFLLVSYLFKKYRETK